MLTRGRVDRTVDPWVFTGMPGCFGWSDASGVEGQAGWSWGGVIAFAGRVDHMLVQGTCPEWVTEPTTAEIWAMSEVGRVILRERNGHAVAALVSDNTHAVFAAVSMLRGSVPVACRGPARQAAEAVLKAAQTGVGDATAATRARACLELLSLGRPTVLRCERTVPELEIADELARSAGGFKPRRDSFVQRSVELRHLVYR